MLENIIDGSMEKFTLVLDHDGRKTDLKKRLDTLIVGQDRAKQELIDAIIDMSGEIVPSRGPIGCFMFTGPTGCGKTESVRALAEVLMGDPDGFTMIHGEQLMDSASKWNLTGSPRGYVGSDKQPFLCKNIYKPYDKALKAGTLHPIVKRYQNFNIILIDEADKLHFDVWQSLIGIMDSGHMELAIGETLDFGTSIIIFTSNMGMAQARDVDSRHGIGFLPPDKTKEKERVMAQELKKFSPELLGRLHSIVHFENLTKDDCHKIIQMYTGKINGVLKGMSADNFPEISLELSPEVENYVVDNGYSGKKGARDMVRFFRAKVERLFGTLLNHFPELENFSNHKIGFLAELDNDKMQFSTDGSRISPKIPPPMPLIGPITPVQPIPKKPLPKKKDQISDDDDADKY